MMHERGNLWCDILWTKYGNKTPSKASLWWKDLNKCCVGAVAGNWFESCLCRRIGEGDATLFWLEDWHGKGKFKDKFADLFTISSQQNLKLVELGCWSNGEWRWTLQWKCRLSEGLEAQLASMLALISSFKPRRGVNDSWNWIKEGNGKYTVSSAYDSLVSGSLVEVDIVFKLLWKVLAPSNAQALCWKLMLNRIQTKDNLLRRSVPIADPSCGLCSLVAESSSHLFLTCLFAWEVWNQTLQWLGKHFVFPANPRDHFLQFAWANSPKHRVGLSTIWLAVVWVLWHGRNAKVFNEEDLSSTSLFEQARLKAWLWLKAKNKNFTHAMSEWILEPLCCLDDI